MSTAHLFDGGPPKRIERLIGLSRHQDATTGNRIFFFVLLGWIPLLDLALVQSALGDAGVMSFIQDFGVHARLLIAVPLLVLADNICGPRLSSIANKFVTSGLIRDTERERFAEVRSDVRGWREARAVEAAIVVVAYILVFLLGWFTPIQSLPAWHASSSDYLAGRSLAGWWHLLVSMPILLVLVLSWLWRVVLWTRFLVATSRLDLHLSAAHPDAAGGLGFVGYSVQAFAVVALAFSVVVAGTLANQVVHKAASLQELGYAIAAVVVTMVVLFCAPLCAFTWLLLRTWRAGVFSYGALALEAGTRFEAKWFAGGKRPPTSVLDAPDFSAVTDLYSIVANVYRMRMVPVGLASMVALAIAATVPFVPVLLLAIPLKQILRSIAGLLM